MTRMRLKSKRTAFLTVLLLSALLSPVGNADTFFGTAPTGLLELQEYRYPVYLYVPQNYKPDRSYPLIISIPAEGESPEKHIQYWMSWAKRRSMMVLCPTNLRPEDLPANMDRWVLQIKSDLMRRYKIDPSKIFLTGRDGGAHYAAYLGVNYPEEFSAAALLNGAWPGRFEKLLVPSRRPVKQIPFLVVAPAGDEGRIKDIEESALALEKKGYPITLMKVKSGEQIDSDAFKSKVIEWMQERSDSWMRVVHESQKSFKEKTFTWFENFFHVN